MEEQTSRITVCFVSTFAYPLFNAECDETFGGSEVQMYLLAKELAKDDNYDVQFITADFGQDEVEKYDGVTVRKSFSVEKSLWNYASAPFKLYNTLKQIYPDVIIQRSAAPETAICAFYSNWNDSRFIYSIAHENDVNGEYAAQGIFGTLYEYGFDRADHIVAQNHDQVALLNDWKDSHAETTVIKSGYPIHDKEPTSDGCILWVGRSDPWKQPEKYIELAKSFPEEKFVMIMPKSSEEQLWNKISRKAKRTENITFIESVPFEDIQSYFDKAKVFVNTSTAEGFPNTFIQSFKARTPVLTLNVDPDKIIEEKMLGKKAFESTEKMKTHLNTLLQDKQAYKKICENCSTYVYNNHNIKDNIESWKKIM